MANVSLRRLNDVEFEAALRKMITQCQTEGKLRERLGDAEFASFHDYVLHCNPVDGDVTSDRPALGDGTIVSLEITNPLTGHHVEL